MTSVAVVVATRNRSGLLPRLLESLAALDPAPAEVVVVDDASTDDTAEVLGAAEREGRLPLSVLRLEAPSGPAVARNAGWRRCTAEFVAFTDDDCRPRPGWLGALVHAAREGAEVVQGRTLPDPSRPRGPFSHTMSVLEFSGRFETCNMLYRRDVLERVGGFDETFRHAYGEDTDLGLRATTSGAAFAFAADAVVYHDVTPSSFVERMKSAHRLEGVVLAVAHHPRLREQMTARTWTKPHHPHALAAMVGATLLLPARRRRSLLLAALLLQVPFLWYRTFVEQLPARKWTWPVVLPMALAVDAVNLAVLARASVKHRTLVL